MDELLSQRKFAAHVGVSHVYIGKLVKEGKITLVNKKIPFQSGMAEFEAAKRLGYENNREHAKKQRAKSGKKPAEPTKAAQSNSEESFSMPRDDEPLPVTGMVSVDKVNQAFNKARLAEKTFQAKLKELDFKEKQGLLIPIESVKEDAAATAEELRGQLLSIGSRISPICEGKPAREIERIIENAINDALRALKKSRFAGR